MPELEILERMRSDWNQRACEDANYYVAFGRREQDDDEFFASAADVVRSLEAELKRLPAHRQRALEIGCGPGRLMRPMSRHFDEIHGVDVADEMIRLAAGKLRGLPQAHVHRTRGADLSAFEDESFDFVYSYAVFQHIPSRDVVLQYLIEARRVLKTGGILRCQINGLPEQAARYTTWDGVRIAAPEVVRFAREHDFQLLALEGASTQYMWTTLRKQRDGWRRGLERQALETNAHIQAVSNTHSGEPLAPARGRFAAASLWVERLPSECDLSDLEMRIDGEPGVPGYIGPPSPDEISQVNVTLPSSIRTGLVPIEVLWLSKPLCAPAWLRVVPPGPSVPRVCSVTDGINILSGTRIVSRTVKLVLEEVPAPEEFCATVDRVPVSDTDFFCTDPLTQRFEINFRLPESIQPGSHLIQMRLGSRSFAPVSIEVQ